MPTPPTMRCARSCVKPARSSGGSGATAAMPATSIGCTTSPPTPKAISTRPRWIPENARRSSAMSAPRSAGDAARRYCAGRTPIASGSDLRRTPLTPRRFDDIGAMLETARSPPRSSDLASRLAQRPAPLLHRRRKAAECRTMHNKGGAGSFGRPPVICEEEQMPEIKRTYLGGGAALALILAAAPAAAWEPTKPVEIVVAAGAGGASDQMARMKQPMVVSLKGGASGAEALIYMKSNEGDPNKVLIAYSLIYMLPLSAKIPFNWRDLTPVSVIALDEFVLWVNTQLPYKTVKEFVAAAKSANPPLKMGGTGSRREDHVLTVFLEKKTGGKFAYLPYKSGGEAATQLVGNHIAANVNNPSENLEVWRASQVRPLCVFDKERIEYKTKVAGNMSWNDVPTCKEEGLDVEYLMLRAMFLPGKVTADQTAFYIDLFKKVSQTAEFKDYLEKQALKPIFLTGPEMVKFLEEDNAVNAQLMNEAG